jgi:CBS-domain-containing membrane protein
MVDISEEDVLKAMKAMQGYIDITPADFREIYRVAYALAMERMKTAIKAGDLMTSPVHLVRLAMSPREAAELLAGKKISGAPVVDDAGKIVGVVSEKDFFKKMGAVRSPLAQPRNLIGGHVLSAVIGVTAYQWIGAHPWLAAGVAVSTAIALMHLTKTLHPPGGATALIAVTGGDTVYRLGYLYALIPVAAGALVMLAIALVVNNIPKNRRYPEFWL